MGILFMRRKLRFKREERKDKEMTRIRFIKASIIYIFLAAASSFLGIDGGLSYGQEADPFYLKLLERGEESYLAGDYREAVSELEIAAFGLLKTKRPLAKSYIYMSLCCYHLKDREKSEKYLRDARDLIGEDELGGLEIHESAQAEFESLLNSLRPEVERERLQIEEDVNEQQLIRRLEDEIKENPREVSLYYQLYDAYRAINNRVLAKRTLEDLVKNNPSEVEGHYLLGKMEYEERDYKKAEKIFEKVLDLFERVQLEEGLAVQVKAYLVLSSHLRGKRNKAKERVFTWLSDFNQEKISVLPIDIEDKERLEKIINGYKAEAEAEREKIRARRLEQEIEDEPQEVSLYYELYDIYRRQRDIKRARETLEELVKNNPNEVTGSFLLGKIEYGRERYREALDRFRRTVVISNESYGERELVLKSMIYVCLCLHHMEQEQSLESYLEDLYDAASEAEIRRLVEEEGLETEWQDIKK
jgi:tetratricopeptide (TPR) repeat protein